MHQEISVIAIQNHARLLNYCILISLLSGDDIITCHNSLHFCDHLQEVDPTVEQEDFGADGMDGFVSELANSIPGIDEAMSFAEMLK